MTTTLGPPDMPTYHRLMERLEGIEGLRQLPPASVLSVGNYDGLHIGHRALLDRMRTLGGPVVVVTFEPHPLTVLRPDRVPPRLMPLSLKLERLSAAGVDVVVTLPPASDVLGLTAEQFWSLLKNEVRPAHLVEGPTFNFGKGRGGTIDKLRLWSAQSDVTLHVVEPVSVVLADLHVAPVSSSLIRWLLSYGRVRDAAVCLGSPYLLRGGVIQGYQRGRKIGFPTANLDCGLQMVPADGVYVGRVTIDGTTIPAAVSVGTLPTFDDGRFQVEAHLLDWSGDLYGRTIDLILVEWVREQWKFSSVDDLTRQIAKDVLRVRDRFRDDPSRAVVGEGKA